jgi:short-subunit dehydrogenase
MKSMFFITGATGGLGKAFAAECASRGWDLFLTDLREDDLTMLAQGLERAYGVRVLTHAANLTDAASCAEMFETIRSQGWKFRGLLNIAGLDYEGLFHERSREEISAIIRLNVEATLIVTHALLDFKDPVIPFRIVNVSSLAAFFSMPVKATYAASKRFLLDFSLALRNELREQNVTVTVLCPAGLPTTAECITAIEAQGIMGQLTTEDIGKVANQTIEAALHGRAIVIPGFLNQALKLLGGLVPSTSLAEIVGWRWRMAHQKSSGGSLASLSENRLPGTGA